MTYVRIGRIPALLAAAVAMVALLLSFASAARAASCDTSWTGGNGNWNTPGGWTGGVPDGNKNACITADGDYTVTLGGVPANAGGTAKSLTLGGSSGTQTIQIEGGTNPVDGQPFYSRLTLTDGSS